MLQQCLPLAVLKRVNCYSWYIPPVYSCNSAYRLRYWNRKELFRSEAISVSALQQCLPLAVLKLSHNRSWLPRICDGLQQCLPLAVLKPALHAALIVHKFLIVATVLTACGIETLVDTKDVNEINVATVLTACGIETPASALYSNPSPRLGCNSAYRLRYWNLREVSLQFCRGQVASCNSAYRLRYWNSSDIDAPYLDEKSCNSAYRLRYWNLWFDSSIW